MDLVCHSQYSLSMPGEVSITQLQMKKIAKELSARDARIAKIIAAHPLCTLGRNPKPVTHFEALVESVISQQLAVKAADTIYGRVKDLAKGRVLPARIAGMWILLLLLFQRRFKKRNCHLLLLHLLKKKRRIILSLY